MLSSRYRIKQGPVNGPCCPEFSAVSYNYSDYVCELCVQAKLHFTSYYEKIKIGTSYPSFVIV